MRKEQLSIGFERAEVDALRSIAIAQERSVAVVVRRMVREALPTEKPAEHDE